MDALNLLFNACKTNDARMAKELAQKDFCLARDKNGMTPLMVAAESGSVEALRIVLPLSNAPDRNRKGDSALGVAAKAGQAACVRELIGPCDPSECDHRGTWPLLGAAWRGDVESVRELLPFTDALKMNPAGGCALSVAIARGQPEMIRLLAPVSSHVGVGEWAGYTSVHQAILKNSVEDVAVACVKELLPYCDLTLRCPKAVFLSPPMTPLEMAREYSIPKVGQLLENWLAEAAAALEAQIIAASAEGPLPPSGARSLKMSL